VSDMSQVITPRSDQLNSDSLLSGPLTIRIREVDIRPGTEQPVSVFYDGDEGKPWKPCKSTSRVLVAAWGPDASKYAGRSVTLYRDPDVKWGGMAVGGIRISHVSHIEKALVLALTEKKGSKKMTTVQPLKVEQQRQEPTDDPAFAYANQYITAIEACDSADAVGEIQQRQAARFAKLKSERHDQADRVQAAIDRKLASLRNDGTLSETNPTATEGRADEDRGDGSDDREP